MHSRTSEKGGNRMVIRNATITLRYDDNGVRCDVQNLIRGMLQRIMVFPLSITIVETEETSGAA